MKQQKRAGQQAPAAHGGRSGAVIYLLSPTRKDKRRGRDVPPLDVQRLHCTRMAEAMQADVVGDYEETADLQPPRWMLMQMLSDLESGDLKVGWVIAYSGDVLADDLADALDVGERIGAAGAQVWLTRYFFGIPLRREV